MVMRRRTAVRLFATILGFPAGARSLAAADPDFQIVVHSDVQGRQVPRETLALIFLKKATRWGDGSRVAPVDQSTRSEVRIRFSRDVLEQSIDGIQSFWSQQMAKGVFPPPVKTSDAEVLEYVASTPGAIGYVSAGAELPPDVRSIEVID
jgi:ABC-type phosphate transport system substrate-binding protein